MAIHSQLSSDSNAITDRNGLNISVGSFVRIVSYQDTIAWKNLENEQHSALGRVCQVICPLEGTSKDGLTIKNGEILLNYAILSIDGVSNITFYTKPEEIEVVSACEELLILYSDELWQVIRPFGEIQDTETFAKLVAKFGYSL
jgi:hypothetical protein